MHTHSTTRVVSSLYIFSVNHSRFVFDSHSVELGFKQDIICKYNLWIENESAYDHNNNITLFTVKVKVKHSQPFTRF